MIIDPNIIKHAKRQCNETIRLAKAQPWAEDINWDMVYIAGGFIASCLQYETPKDIDLYFTTEFSMKIATNILQKNYTDHIKDVDEKYRATVGKDGKMITEKSITMKTSHSFIIMHSGTPADVRSTFDFLHCTPYYDIKEDKLYISEAQYMAATKKVLEVNNPTTFNNLRQDKFTSRGYSVGQSVRDWVRANGESKLKLTATSPWDS